MKQLPDIQTRRKICVYFVKVGLTDPSNDDNQNDDGGGLVCACARVYVCARVCVHACVHASVRDVFAIHDNDILPRLIMIKIKIIFRYFIEIAHTDYFQSKGTRQVHIMTHHFDQKIIGAFPVNFSPMCSTASSHSRFHMSTVLRSTLCTTSVYLHFVPDWCSLHP